MYRKLIVTIITIAVMFTMTFSTGLVYADNTAETTEPEGIPIYTAEELLALDNKDGQYYLANDIDLKDYPNCSIGWFEGTLDGNGFAIYNYTVDENAYKQIERGNIGLFTYLNKAKIKNLIMKDVDINCTLNEPYDYISASAIGNGNNLSLEDITATGNIYLKIKNDGKKCQIGGMFGVMTTTLKLENCTSKINVTCEVVEGKIQDVWVAGVGGYAIDDSIRVKNCKNVGDVRVLVKENAKVEEIHCTGLSNQLDLLSCKNTGNLTVENYGKIKSSLYMFGITDMMAVKSLSKCYNKGNIIAVGGFRTGTIVGLSHEALKISQCYNKGNISINLTSMSDENRFRISGLSVRTKERLSNSYNAGKITCNGKWNGGSIAGLVESCDNKCKITSNYNSGKITVPSGVKYGSIMYWKNGILKNNYYRRGTAFAYDKAKSSQAKKVDAISKKNCSGLSSDYWTYSKSKKRMILKNNKEK